MIRAMVVVAMAAGLGGCGSGVKATGIPRTELNAGYAALYDVVKRNSGVTALLTIKGESEAVKAIVTDVAERCRQAADELDELRRADVWLDYDAMGLPAIDAAARLGIENQTTASLLTSGGREFELHLLQSQLRATSYIAHVAEALAGSDNHADRRAYLRRLSRDFLALHQRLFETLTRVAEPKASPPGASP